MSEPGERWIVTECREGPYPSGVIRLSDHPPTAYRVVDRDDWDNVRGSYATAEQANKRADRLNREDVERQLPAEFAERRKRLRKLGETFWVRYGDGRPARARWPAEPGRYAIREWSERYDESFWDTRDTRAEVEAELLSGDVDRVVDLDTGEDVPFQLRASVAWSGSVEDTEPPSGSAGVESDT